MATQKIQGKQLAEHTVEHSNLSLTTIGTYTELVKLSAATLEYVNNAVSAVTETSGIIGTPSDENYEDGYFDTWESGTTVANSVDDINELLLLLAPPKLSNDWSGAFSAPVFNSTYTANRVAIGDSVSGIINSSTPSFSIADNIAMGTAAKKSELTTFSLDDSAQGIVSNTQIDSGSTSDTFEYFSWTVGDPYLGTPGKEGIQEGITAFAISGNLPIGTASTAAKTLTLDWVDSVPGTYDVTTTYYIDTLGTPSIAGESFDSDASEMSLGDISGVPTLTSGQVLTSLGFTVSSAISRFYNNSFWNLTGDHINNTSNYSVDYVPTTINQATGITNKDVISVANLQFEDEFFEFTINARSANGTSDTQLVTTNTLRIDTTSTENERVRSGSDQYPVDGSPVGDSYVSGVNIAADGANDELQLRGGQYRYPVTNYSLLLNGPDYSSITGWRYATFLYSGEGFGFTNDSAFRMTIPNTNINEWDEAGLRITIKIEGQTTWVDGMVKYNSGNPGSTNGDAALDGTSPLTGSSRRITFANQVLTGDLLIRIGISSSYKGLYFGKPTVEIGAA